MVWGNSGEFAFAESRGGRLRIKAVVLENFRSFRDRTLIPMSPLTAFVGRNDAGKSTILEALDIFFEGGTVKIDQKDAAVRGDARAVRIGVVLNELPGSFVLDTAAASTLRAEYLTNSDGDLEIHKVFNCTIATPKATVSARAVHPTAPGAAELLQKSNRELRTIVRDKGLEAMCNQNENPSMRQAIYQCIGDLALQECDVPLNEENGKAIWGALQSYLPLFALFQSDRPSTDQDPEVQNPMKLAVEQALAELESELDLVTTRVQAKAQAIADRTLDTLRISYPDLASRLTPNFKKPAWRSVFKLDLEADDGIPLNKRGSGVRRLILMSFFQAEAERRRQATARADEPPRPVVYAIEEPETSQHPDSQQQIVQTLRALADSGDQVLFTTHVPALAGLVPVESLRFVDRDPERDHVCVRQGNSDVYRAVAETLGVLPDPVPHAGAKVAVLVEGKNDVDALRSMARVLEAEGVVRELSEDRVFWAIGGGNSLWDWVERQYLRRIGLPIIVIVDSDRTAATLPVDPAKLDRVAAMNAEEGSTAFITRKRNMDNYVHPEALRRLTGGLVDYAAGVDIDFVQMADHYFPLLQAAVRDHGISLNAVDLDGRVIPVRKQSRKRLLSGFVMRQMTAAEIAERSRYQRDDGTEGHEVLEWLHAILGHLH